jgi:hypothetical protein
MLVCVAPLLIRKRKGKYLITMIFRDYGVFEKVNSPFK